MNKIIAVLLFAAAITKAADWAVVTSPTSPITSISKSDLKRVFTGKKSNLAGVKVVPFMLAEASPSALSFLKDVLGIGGLSGRYVVDFRQFG